MPGGDGTGPFGTLRNCMPVNSAEIPPYRPFYGRRFYGVGGFGRGFRRRFLATGIPRWSIFQQQQAQNLQEIQKQAKESEISFLEQELEAIKKRLEELKKQE